MDWISWFGLAAAASLVRLARYDYREKRRHPEKFRGAPPVSPLQVAQEYSVAITSISLMVIFSMLFAIV